VAGAEVSFRGRRPDRHRDYSPLPDRCWRCGAEPVVVGHASCERCLRVMERRARAIRKRYQAGQQEAEGG
jgi:hypothetical protein